MSYYRQPSPILKHQLLEEPYNINAETLLINSTNAGNLRTFGLIRELNNTPIMYVVSVIIITNYKKMQTLQDTVFITLIQ